VFTGRVCDVPRVGVAGVFTGSVTGDRSLKSAGLLGEGHHGTDVIAVKCHLDFCTHLLPRWMRRYDKVLHIVRNPYDALVAERKRLVAKDHFASPPWSAFVAGVPGKRGNEYQQQVLSSRTRAPGVT
jgi:hypothetical protein